MQPEETVDAVPDGLGHDFARLLVVETIDHHAIEPSDRTHLPRTFAPEGLGVIDLLQPAEHAAHDRDGFHRLGRRWFRLDHDLAPGVVDGDVERRMIGQQFQRENALDRIGAAQAGQPVADRVDRLRQDDVVQARAQSALRAHARKSLDILGYARDQPVCRHRDQEPERLDDPEHVDWLAVAVGQIYGEGIHPVTGKGGSGRGRVRHVRFLKRTFGMKVPQLFFRIVSRRIRQDMPGMGCAATDSASKLAMGQAQ